MPTTTALSALSALSTLAAARAAGPADAELGKEREQDAVEEHDDEVRVARGRRERVQQRIERARAVRGRRAQQDGRERGWGGAQTRKKK